MTPGINRPPPSHHASGGCAEAEENAAARTLLRNRRSRHPGVGELPPIHRQVTVSGYLRNRSPERNLQRPSRRQRRPSLQRHRHHRSRPPRRANGGRLQGHRPNRAPRQAPGPHKILQHGQSNRRPRRVVPELIQKDFTPDRVSEEVVRLLKDPSARDTLRAGLAEVRNRPGPPGAVDRAADAIATLLSTLAGNASNPSLLSYIGRTVSLCAPTKGAL